MEFISPEMNFWHMQFPIPGAKPLRRIIPNKYPRKSYRSGPNPVLQPDNDKEIKSIGLISDTHGLLRRKRLSLRGSELIIHAGDVGKPAILEELRKLRRWWRSRNVDEGEWAKALPQSAVVEAGSVLSMFCTM